MTLLPDSYLSPLHLPFNTACLQQRFELQAPDADPGGGQGVWLLLRNGEMWLQGPAEMPFLPGSLPSDLFRQGGNPLYLGTWDGRPCRLLELGATAVLPAGWVAVELADWYGQIPIEPLSLGGAALQILHWERSSRCCPQCGGNAQRLSGEWGKRCPQCGWVFFPNVHPCAITLVKRPGEVLLTRKAEWPSGRYSLVSGFVHFGECLEEAAAREVREETGVEITNLRYVGSQCWPFPSQLMAGFVADYAGGELQVDYQELEDARWFAIDALPAMPPLRSISRYILDNFLSA
jgi:NAD+ diphosphatase